MSASPPFPPLEKVEPNLYQKVLPRSLLKNNKFGSTFSKGGNIILLKQFKPKSLYMNNNHKQWPQNT